MTLMLRKPPERTDPRPHYCDCDDGCDDGDPHAGADDRACKHGDGKDIMPTCRDHGETCSAEQQTGKQLNPLWAEYLFLFVGHNRSRQSLVQWYHIPNLLHVCTKP